MDEDNCAARGTTELSLRDKESLRGSPTTDQQEELELPADAIFL